MASTMMLARGGNEAVARYPMLLLALLAVAVTGCGGERGTPLVVRAPGGRRPTAGPLRISPTQRSFFVEAGTGRAILLTGSHTWNNFQDWGLGTSPPALDYTRYLDFLEAHGHDFIRLYVWEQSAWFPGTEAKVVIAPLPYLRTGPGVALDGGPRFDLTKFEPAYFARLRERVEAARARGIYVSVMLFDGWSIALKREKTGNPWRGHPFHRANNINGIDGDRDGDGQGQETHLLGDSAITRLQKAYVAKVVATLGDLDNVLWEVSNESDPKAAEWEYEMIRTLHALEAARGIAHPVGMTSLWPPDAQGNAPLFHSPADWVAPHDDAADPYKTDPPPSTSRDKLVISDTDHLWGIGGRPDWVWRTFLRGLNPIYMDCYETTIHRKLPTWTTAAPIPSPVPEYEDMRVAMGYARAVSERVDLLALRPSDALASSGYCLAAPGREYLAYLPAPKGRLRRLFVAALGPAFHERVRLDLTAAPGVLDVEWVDPRRGLVFAEQPVRGGAAVELRAPFAGDALVHLRHIPSAGAREESR